MTARSLQGLLLVLLVARGTSGCHGHGSNPSALSDARERGRKLTRDFGCAGCHVIPGIRQARGVVGPPLISFARRAFIAGEVPNTPTNLVRWLMDPPSIESKTAMPALGLSEDQARDIASFLYTLD